jgi:hypothetical protein
MVIFVRKLYEYLFGVNQKFKSEAFAPIRAIANVVVVVRWESQKMDAIICGASGRKLPIKRHKNTPAKLGSKHWHQRRGTIRSL